MGEMGDIYRRKKTARVVFSKIFGKAALIFCAVTALSAVSAVFMPLRAGDVPDDGTTAEQETPDANRFVLTRLGIVQEGIPEDRGETIFLRLPNSTGGLTISKLDILFIGRTRPELFEFQRRQLPEGDVGSLLKLADWALRNQLAPEAIALLKRTAEKTVDPSARAALLERLAKMEYVERIKSEALRRMSPSGDSSDSANGSAAETLDPEQTRLLAFAKEIPFTVEERFTRKIEPILLRRCAAADCHLSGSHDTVFPLVEPSSEKSLRFGHLRNLETVLGAVSFHRPETSPILNHPSVTDENGERIWPFGEDSASLKDYEQFVEWVTSLGPKMKNYIPDPARQIKARHQVEPTQNSADSGPESAPDAVLAANIPLAETREHEKPNPNDDAEALKRAGYLPTETLRDEFDPTPFNRKYHPQRPSGGLPKQEF